MPTTLQNDAEVIDRPIYHWLLCTTEGKETEKNGQDTQSIAKRNLTWSNLTVSKENKVNFQSLALSESELSTIDANIIDTPFLELREPYSSAQDSMSCCNSVIHRRRYHNYVKENTICLFYR